MARRGQAIVVGSAFLASRSATRRSWKRRGGACGRQAFFQGAVVGGELADALLEGGVFRGDPLDGFLGPFGLRVADLAEEFADAGALGEDLGVGDLEGVLGVERPFSPGRLVLVVLWGARTLQSAAELR